MPLEPGSSAFNHALDNFITGHYGEDQFPPGSERCEGCARKDCGEDPRDCDGPHDAEEVEDDE